MDASSSTAERLTAELADRYRIERELGAGGMATVYLAEDLKHHRKVAIKVLHPDLSAVLGPERFLREIETTASLRHPHILPLFDSGEAGQRGSDAGSLLFYVMPLVEGESLRDRLHREKQLPVDDALQIAREVADALSYAHSRSIVHRDIKPGNILLESGHAVVADFGIAKAVRTAGGEALTATGMSLGTPAYMSPEQAAGEQDLDGRSDLYALACVLYEMLAGQPPFIGVTSESLVRQHMVVDAPPVTNYRPAVPASAAAALRRALAKAPADRFATVREFVVALGQVTVPSSATTSATPSALPTRRSQWRRWAGAGVTLCLLAAVAVFLTRQKPSAPVLDADLIAVAPFDAVDPALTVWREGVVDLLARTLDGAGVLRTVSPSVVLSRWQGRSDRASVGALATRTGAGMAIIGNLAPRGTDSVVVSATLVDTRADRIITETAVSGTIQHLGELIEQLGRALLDGLSRERPVGAVRQIAMSRAPLPALKAFLRGEQFYRRIGYDSALAAYAEAVAGDSGFTMAYYRMHQVLDWNPPTTGRYAGSEWYSGQAHRRNRGLSERDSLLVRIDSILTSHGSVATFHLAQQELDAAVSRFPGDPEIWTAYGELWFHASDVAAADRPQRALAAFDRAIAADSSFFPAYEHTLALTAMLGGRDRTLPYARALARLLPPGSSISALSLAGRLLLAPDSERRGIVASVAPAAGATELFTAELEIFRWIPDSAETAVLLARALARRSLLPGDAPPHVVDSLMRLHYLALTLAVRGHLSEAVRADSALLEDPGRVSWSWFLPLAGDLAYLGALAPAAVLPALRPEPVLDKRIVTARYVTATQRSLGAAAWWDRRGDTTALSSHARSLQRAQAGKQNPLGAARLAYAEAVVRGYLALARGDTSAALQSFGQQPSTFCDGDISCSAEIARVVDVLLAQGKRQRAAELLDYLIVSHVGPRSVLFRLERGHLAEQLGDTAGAVRAYRFVVDAWRNADRVLQPNVTEARAGLARLQPR